MDIRREIFFDNQVHINAWKDAMCGKNEKDVVELLESIGYKFGVDFVRQFPVGKKFVMDIAFVKERFCIEVDGKSHNSKTQKKLDKMRDDFLRHNDWSILRIKDTEFQEKKSFYKNLIKEVVEDIRKDWEVGIFCPDEEANFKQQDYE